MGFLVYAGVTGGNFGLCFGWGIPDWVGFDSIVTYFFLNVLTISAAALFTSGIERATVYKTAIGSFILTMAFFLFILMLELMARPLMGPGF